MSKKSKGKKAKADQSFSEQVCTSFLADLDELVKRFQSMREPIANRPLRNAIKAQNERRAKGT